MQQPNLPDIEAKHALDHCMTIDSTLSLRDRPISAYSLSIRDRWEKFTYNIRRSMQQLNEARFVHFSERLGLRAYFHLGTVL